MLRWIWVYALINSLTIGVFEVSQEIFNRYELKYLISYEEYLQLAAILKERMNLDPYGDHDGKYNIVSLYYDSDDRKIYYETKNKLRFRQKLRLRIYNQTTADSISFFEIKQKFGNVVNKRRTILPLSKGYDLSNTESLSNIPDLDVFRASNNQILKEVHHFKSLYHLHPEVVVSYDRQAFSGIEEPDLRVTFDYNLMCRNDDLRIENGPQGMFFIPEDTVVLEVKVSSSVPFWLARLLNDMQLARQSVSKYCTSIDLTDNQAHRQQHTAYI